MLRCGRVGRRRATGRGRAVPHGWGLTDDRTTRDYPTLHWCRTLRNPQRRDPWSSPRRGTARCGFSWTDGQRRRARLSSGPPGCGVDPTGVTTAHAAAGRGTVGLGLLVPFGGAIRGKGVTKLTGDRGLHRRGGRLHILAEISEFLQHVFTGDTELFRELVHAGLACHCSPHWWSRRQSRSTPLLVHVHRRQSFTTAGTFRNRPALCV